jgi:hypothetical protein
MDEKLVTLLMSPFAAAEEVSNEAPHKEPRLANSRYDGPEFVRGVRERSSAEAQKEGAQGRMTVGVVPDTDLRYALSWP